MALEIARLTIDPANAPAFERAVDEAVPLFHAAEGCHSINLLRSHETDGGYWLLVEWTDVAAHETFRATPAFARWRALVGDYFVVPPAVEHGLGCPGIGALQPTGDNA